MEEKFNQAEMRFIADLTAISSGGHHAITLTGSYPLLYMPSPPIKGEGYSMRGVLPNV